MNPPTSHRGKPGRYLIFMESSIDPSLFGPFTGEDERDRQARTLRRARGEDHVIFMLDIDPADGSPSVDAYCGAFFMEDDGT